jgi:proton glutamate symport protein
MRLGLFVLLSLAVGLVAGALIRAQGPGPLNDAAHGLTIVGTLWLDALRMTLAPLIFALVVDAVLKVAEQAAAGALARRVLGLFAALLVLACLYVTGLGSTLLALVPVDPQSAAALVSAGAGTAADTARAGEAAPVAAPVDLAAWLRSLLPTNVIAAASTDKVVALVVFAILFALAVSRLETERRTPLAGLFRSLAEAMIVIVGWVLLLAPVGVFGLALSLGLDTGFDAVGAVAHYLVFTTGLLAGQTLIALLLLLVGARMPPLETLRATLPVQAIAASTQSSLASLPAMLAAAMGPLKVRPHVAEFTLPLAVAVFRMSSPVGNLAVALFVAHVTGVQLELPALFAGCLVAIVVSISSVGLPGQSSFFVSVAPICVALGVPVEVLPLLLAVEVIPDVFRTLGNVTADLAVTTITDRSRRDDASVDKQT